MRGIMVGMLLAVNAATMAAAQEPAAPLAEFQQQQPVVADTLLGASIVVRLTLPARVVSAEEITGELEVENTGMWPCLIPADLRLCAGVVRLQWTRPDGQAESRCKYARDPVARVNTLMPGACHRQRFTLGITEGPCVRMKPEATCNWAPGHYVFTATLLVPRDAIRHEPGDVSPRLITGRFTSQPVTVDVVRE